MQRGAVERWQPTGLNTSLPTLPELLRPAGYRNYLVGKWSVVWRTRLTGCNKINAQASGLLSPGLPPQQPRLPLLLRAVQVRGGGTAAHCCNVLCSHVTDYYTRRLSFTEFGGEQEAADLHENFQPSTEGEGEFSPDLYSR